MVKISQKDKLNQLLSTRFVMSMLTDPEGEFLSDEDIKSEFDYDLNIKELKEELYAKISQMIYEGYNSEDIIEEIYRTMKDKRYRMISKLNKKNIMNGAKRLVLERKDDNNE